MTFRRKERLNLYGDRRLGSLGRIPNIYEYFAKPIDFVPEAAGGFMKERYLEYWCLPRLNFMHPTPSYYAEQDWQLLVSIICRLRHLTEISYAVENIFPDRLLRAIHDHHPLCRRSVWSFQVLGLNEAGLGHVQLINRSRLDSLNLGLLRLIHPGSPASMAQTGEPAG